MVNNGESKTNKESKIQSKKIKSKELPSMWEVHEKRIEPWIE